jgi:WD40 repeat protein
MGDCCGPCHDRREAGERPAANRWPPRTVLEGHTTEIMNVAFGKEGRLLMSQGMFDATARLWDVESGACQFMSHDDWLWSAAFSPTGPRVALGSRDTTSIWDAEACRREEMVTERWGTVMALAFSPIGTILAVVYGSFYYPETGTLAVWDLEDKDASAPTSPLYRRRARYIAFAPDGQTLAAATQRDLHLWDLADGRDVVPFMSHDRRVRALAFSPDGNTLATADEAGYLHLWDATQGRETAVPWRHPGQPYALAFSPDGQFLASTASDRTLRFWDVAGRRERAAFLWHCGGVRTVAFSPDGEWLATGGDDDLVKLWPWRRLLGL